MACNLSKGRNEVCKDSIGGLAGVYFLNYTTSSFTKNADGEVTAFPSGSTVYYYQLKGTSAYTETVNTSRENGTTFFSQELVLNLKKLTNEMTTQMKLMAYGRPQIVVHTMNGDALLVGEEEGADVTAGSKSDHAFEHSRSLEYDITAPETSSRVDLKASMRS